MDVEGIEYEEGMGEIILSWRTAVERRTDMLNRD